ncbi:alanine--tRNA ligase, mitochondrial-like [Mantella aurantiaca]
MACPGSTWRVRGVHGVSGAYMACPGRGWRVRGVHGVSGEYMACPGRGWRVRGVHGVSGEYMACPGRGWRVRGVHGVSGAWMACPGRGWRVRGVHGVSGEYMACPGRTWRVRGVDGVSGEYMACPGSTWRVRGVDGVSGEYMACPGGGWRVRGVDGVSGGWMACPGGGWRVLGVDGVSGGWMACPGGGWRVRGVDGVSGEYMARPGGGWRVRGVDGASGAWMRNGRSQQAEAALSGLQLDVHSLAELQRRGIPTTDHSPKYSYTLEDDGKYVFSPCPASILMLYKDGSLHGAVSRGQRCGVILDRTCYYAEQGGQSSDRGYFVRDGEQDVLFPVESLHLAGGYVLHEVTATEPLRAGDHVTLFLDEARRISCMEKHTATHLLNFTLRQVLGESAAQRGSHVTAERLRFDVTGSVTGQQLQEVENILQNLIGQNQEVYTAEIPLSDTRDVPGLRRMDEVYPDPVRVISVGVPIQEVLSPESRAAQQTSVELCCGTHLLKTGSIGDLVIISEKPLVRGIVRLIAVTGEEAREARETAQALRREVESIAERMKMTMTSSLSEAHRLSKEVGLVSDSVDSAPIPQWQRKELQASLRSLQRSANTAVRKAIGRRAAEIVPPLLERHAQIPVIVDCVEEESLPVLMKAVFLLCERRSASAVMLFSRQSSGKVLCACQVPKSPSPGLSALDWAVAVCASMGGKAGGSHGSANGNGSCEDLGGVLEAAVKYARRKLSETRRAGEN